MITSGGCFPCFGCSCLDANYGPGVRRAYAFHQDKASSVKVPVAKVTLFSSAHLLRENTDSEFSRDRCSVGITEHLHCGSLKPSRAEFDTNFWKYHQSQELEVGLRVEGDNCIGERIPSWRK
ncbi:hypothetical protein Tco_0442883 [Tanacetum coccineum]